jgi:hypothetical protein
MGWKMMEDPMAILLATSALIVISIATILVTGLAPEAGIVPELLLVSMALAGFVTIAAGEGMG